MREYTFSQYSKLKKTYIKVSYTDAELEETLKEPKEKLIEWGNRTMFCELPVWFYNRLIFSLNKN